MPVMFLGPAWLRRKIIEWTPSKRVQHLKYIVDVMYERSISIVEEKKAVIAKGDELSSQQHGGKDFMRILCAPASTLLSSLLCTNPSLTVRANQGLSEKDMLSDDEIYAQTSYVSSFILTNLSTLTS